MIFFSTNNLLQMDIDIIIQDIQTVKDLERQYKEDSKDNLNSQNAIGRYIKWYSAALSLFDECIERLIINNNDPDYQHFKQVKADGNGFVLQEKFNRIYPQYFVLLKRIERRMSDAHLSAFTGNNNLSAYQMVPKLTNDPTQSTNDNNSIQIQSQMNNNKIFIVHGHDEAMKEAVARFITRLLNIEPIILHEKANAGRTIIQKLLDETKDLTFAIVLYSPDDLGKAHEEEKLNPRARQNVVFEHGLLIGKYGMNRVCCLHKGNIEMPSDNHGVLYIEYDDNEGWQKKLAREMKNIGMGVDMNKLI